MASNPKTRVRHSSQSLSSIQGHASPITYDPDATAIDNSENQLFQQHLHLLRKPPSQHEVLEATTAPIFTMPILKHAEGLLSQGATTPISQYGLIGGLAEVLRDVEMSGKPIEKDPRIFFNVATPSSVFICGSQGSGKSHTLSCLLENCLSPSQAGKLPKPLTGIVFHYDTFISDGGGSPCEAAFLSSNPNIKVRVLCSPTNIRTIEVTSF